MTKQILLTGGAGFIGSHTADALLAQGYKVRVLDALIAQVHPQQTRPDYLAPEVELIVGDICDQTAVSAALDGVDIVYHFAAETGVGQSMYELERYTQTNVTGTAVLWQEIQRRQAPLERFILASSRAVYGEGKYNCRHCGIVYPNQRPVNQLQQADWQPRCPRCQQPVGIRSVSETTPKRPVSIYGLTKQHQEELSVLMGQTLDTPVTILRYFNVYGPRQAYTNPYTGVVIHFFRQAMQNEPLQLYEQGLPIRDFVHVLDVVQANLLALKENESLAIYNVGSGQQMTISDLAKTVLTAVGQPAESYNTTNRFRVGDIFGSFANLCHIQRQLGYQPEVAFADGLATLLASWSHDGHKSGKHIVADTDAELRRWRILHG
ncbi:MAG: NAD-dependent epimerase/dehydratase family protein [Chloroflexota bacterium]